MKLTFLLACLLSLRSATATGAESREVRVLDFYPGGKVTVDLRPRGSAKIVGWEHASLRLEVIRRTDGQASEGDLEKIRFEVAETPTLAAVQALPVTGVTGPWSAHYTLHVPRDRTDLRVSVGQGSVEIENINGWIEVDVGSGDLLFTRVSGYVSASTRSGHVRARLDGDRWKGHSFSAATHKGDVELVLPASDFSVQLFASTDVGEILIGYPGEHAVFKKKKKRALIEVLGRGGSAVKVHTKSGTVRINRG
ncbi:MAG: DUF4097 family beta strand repeat protein [Acidobacteria bacterium]|nr:DUF4097 family beta strand repeat protein [Acidobacteriota bacterium]